MGGLRANGERARELDPAASDAGRRIAGRGVRCGGYCCGLDAGAVGRGAPFGGAGAQRRGGRAGVRHVGGRRQGVCGWQLQPGPDLAGVSVSRTNLAAFDLGSGALIGSWQADVHNGVVRGLATSGSYLYVGGSYSRIGGVAPGQVGASESGDRCGRQRIPPSARQCGQVRCGGWSVFAGGQFTVANGVSHDHLAKFDLLSGASITSSLLQRTGMWTPRHSARTAPDSLSAAASQRCRAPAARGWGWSTRPPAPRSGPALQLGEPDARR